MTRDLRGPPNCDSDSDSVGVGVGVKKMKIFGVGVGVGVREKTFSESESESILLSGLIGVRFTPKNSNCVIKFRYFTQQYRHFSC